MNILLFYYDFNLDVELLVCALLTNSIHSIHSNRLTEQPFVFIITVETHQKNTIENIKMTFILPNALLQ